MIQSIEKLTEHYNTLSNNYDSITDTFHHNICKYIIEKNLFLELPKDTTIYKVLDSGGGTGYWSIRLAQKGYNVILSDISIKELEIAKNKIKKAGLNIQILECNSECTPFNDEEFDIIVLNGGVISYTPNPEDLLNECNRILKKGGLLWFDFLNSVGWAIEEQNDISKIDLALSDEKLIQMKDWDYPARVFSIKNIENKLQSARFTLRSKYGLVLLTNSLPLQQRYSSTYSESLFEKYKQIELELSRCPECIGSSWSCCFAAIKE